MKAPLFMLALSIVLGVAMAQTPPTPPTQGTNQKATPTDPQTNTQPSAKAGAQTGSGSTIPAEMKTSTFKGVLVDMSCSSRASGSSDTTPGAGEATKPSDQSKAPASDQSNTANRSASDSETSCPVSANSSELGMKLDDGKLVHFDLVGNQRAQDAVKNDKRWIKEISANRPLHAKVSGVLNGDKLIVSSIH
jgi:hypothetical protein